MPDFFSQDAAQWIFIAASAFAVMIVYALPIFDMRALVGKDAYRGALERADLIAVAAVLLIAGVALSVAAGWRAPLEIERAAQGAPFSFAAPDVDLSQTGRVGQLLGAFFFGLIALRMARPAMWAAGAVGGIALALFAARHLGYF